METINPSGINLNSSNKASSELIADERSINADKIDNLKSTAPSCCIETGRKGQKLILEWFKMDALSEEFANKMASLADLGIESFRSVEIEFLSAYPNAVEEDQSFSAFAGLKGVDLENAMDAKLRHIFLNKTRPQDLNEDFRSLMMNACYYLITIKEESSDKIQGFVTFLQGGPVPEDELKVTVLAIDKDVRKEGFASFLINSLKSIDVKSKKILVSTRPSNFIAINAYKKWGFIEDFEAHKTSPYLIKGHWVHLVRYESC